MRFIGGDKTSWPARVLPLLRTQPSLQATLARDAAIVDTSQGAPMAHRTEFVRPTAAVVSEALLSAHAQTVEIEVVRALRLDLKPFAHDGAPFLTMGRRATAEQPVDQQMRQFMRDGLFKHGIWITFQKVFIDFDALLYQYRTSCIATTTVEREVRQLTLPGAGSAAACMC